MSSRLLFGGHRGVGENLWIEGKGAGPSAVVPIYRENTIRSFLRSTGLGVDFIEFDVQASRTKYVQEAWNVMLRMHGMSEPEGLSCPYTVWYTCELPQVTSDGVPVIWHDDSVIQLRGSEVSSTEIKSMTLARFKQVVHIGEGDQQLVRKFRGVHSRAEIPGDYLPW